MKKNYFIVFALLLVVFSFKITMAQNLKYCGQAEAEERIRIENPKLYREGLKAQQELELQTKAYNSQKSGERGTVYFIPVVFHIIHDFGPENISDQQVYDAIQVINTDFRKLNADTSEIVAAFKSLAGDSEIEFRLAQKDPNGNCTNGIVRVASLETYNGVNYFDDMSTSNVSRWPRSKYLNIWVVNSIKSGAAGYTYRPSAVNSNPNLDGIMVLHNYVGSIGTASVQRSRTLTHEIGHWINLAHTWGQTNNPGISTNCNDDDAVSDTPNTIGWTSCNLSGNTCSSLDNVQNYMDYSYCSKMFTQGQSARMRAATISNISQRSSLWQPGNLAATGTDNANYLCKADFVASRTEVCVGELIDFNDISFNNPSTWNWTFPGGTVSSTTIKNPVVSYSTPGQYNVGLLVSDGVSNLNETKNNFITVLPTTGIPLPYVEGFESSPTFPNGNWFVFNTDNAQTWEVANVGATGSKSIRINNFNNPVGAIDEISSTAIDLSPFVKVNISFKVAFAKKDASATTDELKFFASSNCGLTWVQRWSQSSNLTTVPAQASPFIPTDSIQWVQYTISTLPIAYMNSNFRFKFQFKNGGGNNIYIDDININDYSVGINEQDEFANHFRVYPNPFNEDAVIAFSLNKTESVELSVIDILGKETFIYQERNLPSGEHTLKLNKSELGMSKGIYFVKLTQADKVMIKKIILN
ncbi:MAG: T9SS type A sorting domain-containing protein [Bacteroidetes bacterium]|nr:T9SS type A sorting domain-containing protein [Bacteroidota bacterium]HET6245443.1 M43 family zinc metalloprotease [Bacteroidia bacterium]